MRNFVIGFGIQFLSYLVLTVNFRAIAESQRGFAMVTDALAVVLSYSIIRRVVKDDSWWTLAGMVTGGSLAAWVGITLTEHWRTSP